MMRVKRYLTPTQLDILQRCSKDAQSYQELVALFELISGQAPLPIADFATSEHELLPRLPDVLPEAFYIFDSSTNAVIYHNRVFAALMHLTDATPLLEGPLIDDMVHPDDQTQLRFFFNELEHRPNGAIVSFMARVRVGTERYQPLLLRNMVITRTPTGEIHLIGGYISDPAQMSDVQKLNEESQTRFLRLANSLPDTLFIFDLETRRSLYENRPTFLGHTIDEIATADFIREILWPDDVARVSAYWESIRSSVYDSTQPTPIFEIECQLRARDGRWEWVHQRTAIITLDAQHHAHQVLVTMAVVTERKQIEQALKTSEQQYRDLLNILPMAISVGDSATLELLFWNQAFEDILKGNQDAGHSFQGWQQTLTPENRAASLKRVEALRRGEDVPPYEYEMTYPDGQVHIIRSHPARITFEQRPALLTVTQDITPRKHMEEALRESEQRYRILSEITSDYAFQFNVDADGQPKRVWLTGNFEEMTGFTIEESAARGGWMALAHPDDIPRRNEQIRRLLERPCNLSDQYRIVTKNGSVRHIWGNEISIADPVTGRVTQIFGIGQDITERVQMQNALLERERFIQHIADTMPAVMVVHDLRTHRNVWVNDYLSEYTGESREEMLHRETGPYDRIFHPDDSPQLAHMVEELLAAKDGQYCATEARIRRFDGVYRWFGVRMVVFERDADGAVKSMIGMMLDINDQKEAQAAIMNSQLLEVAFQKEHELNQLKNKMMQRISHEFRTPLAIILSSSYVLQRVDSRVTEEKRQRHFNSIQAQIARVVAMLEDIQFIIYDEAQMHETMLLPTQLPPLLQTAIDKAQAAHSEPRDVRIQLDPTIPEHVAVDERLFKMILTNLISNAFKFSNDKTPVVIDVSVDMDWLRVRVRDEGIGVPPEDIPRIFDPFYRANNFDEKPGLGIGLTIVKNALDLYGGNISIEGSAAVGSIFTVRLPLTEHAQSLEGHPRSLEGE